MKVKRIYLTLLLFIPILTGITGCGKMDTLPQLVISVYNENGELVKGAFVALFDSPEEWYNRNNPVQVWRRTGDDGKVIFVDLKEITYYFYARFDGKDNSVGEISTQEPLQMNQRTIISVHIK